jgi:lipoprotein-anchoring transpeptidase ErfK/SrfK
VDKEPSVEVSVVSGAETYRTRVSYFIDLGPNGPLIYAMPWQQPHIGNENDTHGDVGLNIGEAVWLYGQLAVGDTVQIMAGPAQ